LLSSPVLPFPSPRSLALNVYQNERQAPVWEQAVFVIWLFALYVPLLEFSPLRYACIGVALCLFFYHRKETFSVLARSWPLLPYPILGLLSVGWSPFPEGAMRVAILQILLPVFLATLACRLRPTEFLRVMMLAGLLAVLYCVPYYATLSTGGPYAQKNLAAYQMMLVTLVSLATALNAKEKTLFRLIALAVVPVAFLFQLQAGSATSLVFAVGGSAVLVTVKIFWEPVSNVANLRSMLLFMLLALIGAGLLVLLSAQNNTYIADFLELVGKDTTLTGRTGIWEAAAMVSAEHPWLGVGLDGFWQPNTGLAQTLSELTHSDPGSSISFHSAFWEVRVHLGYVGFAFFILTLVWAGYRTLRLWLINGSVVNSAFLLFYCIILISCFTESYPSGAFSTITVLLYMGAYAGYDMGGRKLVGKARLVEEAA
jgi:exopolysaccharide production protein ExoQ